MKAARVLVTGATGFIGRDLIQRLARNGWLVRAAARDPSKLDAVPGIEPITLGDLTGSSVDWHRALDGVSHIVHLAGIAHATRTIPDAVYHAVNADAVGALARAAQQTGVSRIVLMSSIRAQCGASANGVLTEVMPPEPVDAYGRAKLAGEHQLAAALSGSATTGCVLRPVLVYGPGVKGNMANLARLAATPWPLPIASLTARRSLLGLENLSFAVIHAMTSPTVAGGTFLLADPDPMTVPGIVAAMRESMGRPSRLIPLPLAPVRAAALLAGQRSAWERIAGDLVVSTAALEATGWRPRETAREGLGRWMRASRSATTAA